MYYLYFTGDSTCRQNNLNRTERKEDKTNHSTTHSKRTQLYQPLPDERLFSRFIRLDSIHT